MKLSQNDKLAAYFRQNPNRDIPMPELAQVITPTGIGAAVHSRIADLRKRGLDIEQKSIWADGQCHSHYRFSAGGGVEVADTAQVLYATDLSPDRSIAERAARTTDSRISARPACVSTPTSQMAFLL